MKWLPLNVQNDTQTRHNLYLTSLVLFKKSPSLDKVDRYKLYVYELSIFFKAKFNQIKLVYLAKNIVSEAHYYEKTNPIHTQENFQWQKCLFIFPFRRSKKKNHSNRRVIKKTAVNNKPLYIRFQIFTNLALWSHQFETNTKLQQLTQCVLSFFSIFSKYFLIKLSRCWKKLANNVTITINTILFSIASQRSIQLTIDDRHTTVFDMKLI